CQRLGEEIGMLPPFLGPFLARFYCCLLRRFYLRIFVLVMGQNMMRMKGFFQTIRRNCLIWDLLKTMNARRLVTLIFSDMMNIFLYDYFIYSEALEDRG
ncbi:hypothetical protein TcCL_Unassigned02318, partial [Trypanosoma cruzi]